MIKITEIKFHSFLPIKGWCAEDKNESTFLFVRSTQNPISLNETGTLLKHGHCSFTYSKDNRKFNQELVVNPFTGKIDKYLTFNSQKENLSNE